MLISFFKLVMGLLIWLKKAMLFWGIVNEEKKERKKERKKEKLYRKERRKERRKEWKKETKILKINNKGRK